VPEVLAPAAAPVSRVAHRSIDRGPTHTSERTINDPVLEPLSFTLVTATSNGSAGRGVRCFECAIQFDEDPETYEPYCPWCGARNPACVQMVAWAEFQAEFEATNEEGVELRD
jgi:hypothetical protein